MHWAYPPGSLSITPSADQGSRIQSKASFTARLLITPPIRHVHNLARSEEQEDQQHVEVESSIESRSKDVIPSGPHVIAMTIGPIHDDEATKKCARVPGANVAVEEGHGSKEDSCIPESKLHPREESIQSEKYDW